ncbi:MAG: hypothetical protein R6V85_10355 [Polyangia bacterium]
MKKSATTTAIGLFVLSLAGGSAAFTGGERRVDSVPPGTEWLAGHSGSSKVGFVRKGPAELSERYGGHWTQRRGGPTGDFRRIWGSGVPVGQAAVGDDLVALEVAEAFWEQNEDLLPGGAGAADLEPAVTSVWQGLRTVTHRQTVDGVPVLGSSAMLAIRAGRIVLIGVHLFPVQPVETRPSLDVDEAEQAALAALSDREVAADVERSELVLFPVLRQDAPSLRLVWAVELKGAAWGRWTAYIDARRGSLLALRDERLFVTGSLRGRHHERHPGGEIIESPLSHLYISTDDGDDTTDADGAFSVAGDTTALQAWLSGMYATIANKSGSDLFIDEIDVGADPLVLDSEASEAEFAQVHAYVFTNKVRDHARELVDDLAWLDAPLPVNVNNIDLDGDEQQDFCNAWFDGQSLNFLMAGDPGWGMECNNTAMIGDILYHEYGHGFHLENAMLGSMVFDEAISEGFADTMASSVTLDSKIAPYFTTEGHHIRDLEPDLVWPTDVSEDPHQTGLIVGGAYWDLRTAFRDEHGEEQGNAMLDTLFAGATRVATDIPSAYESTLVADDDNGNIEDGTPHFCQIYDAFAAHGLANEGAGRVVIEHEQLDELADPAQPVVVEADVWVAEEACNEMGQVRLVYSVDEGETWTSEEMENLGSDSFSHELGTFPEGTELLYRIEADEELSGDVITRPSNAAEPYYRAYVGPLEAIVFDDFESEDDSWTHELTEGIEREGADDWQWGVPAGKGGDPEEAYSPTHVWGNDLAPASNWNGEYQPGKVNALISPAYDLSDYEIVRLRLRRWLTVEDGYYDQATIYVGSEGDWQPVWTNFVSEGDQNESHVTHHIDREWVLFDLDISEWAAGQSDVQVRFEIASDAGLQFGGWTIDDFGLYTKGQASDPDEEADAGADAGDGGGSSGGCGCFAAGASRSAGVFETLFSLL